MSDLSPMTPAPQAFGLMSAESQRAIAEIQAGMIIARMNPRDLVRARDLILQDCTRESLAERAVYSYSRGGADVSGPSIRLAEVMAQRLGNISYGVRELEQRVGESVVQAYAMDMETGTRREMTFTVKHVRDTKQGRRELTDARDIYEMTANQGARRVRACLLGIIPGDITEAAVRQCEATLHTKAALTPDRIQAMLDYFAEVGVSRAMIEARVQRRLDAITPALFVQLGKIANSIRDGMSKPGDWFEVEAESVAQTRGLPVEVGEQLAQIFAELKWNPAQRTVFLAKHLRNGYSPEAHQAILAELQALVTPAPPAKPAGKRSHKRMAKAAVSEPALPAPSPSAAPACEHGTPIDEPCDRCIAAADALATQAPESATQYAERRIKELALHDDTEPELF